MVPVAPASVSGASTTGAFLIRNSWGTAWGEAGYRVPLTYAHDGYSYTTEDIVTGILDAEG